MDVTPDLHSDASRYAGYLLTGSTGLYARLGRKVSDLGRAAIYLAFATTLLTMRSRKLSFRFSRACDAWQRGVECVEKLSIVTHRFETLSKLTGLRLRLLAAGACEVRRLSQFKKSRRMTVAAMRDHR